MAKVRVYELAKELGVESKTLLAHLKSQGEFVRSASSTIEPPVVRKINETFPRDALRRRRRPGGPQGRHRRGPRRAQQAAPAAGVAPPRRPRARSARPHPRLPLPRPLRLRRPPAAPAARHRPPRRHPQPRPRPATDGPGARAPRRLPRRAGGSGRRARAVQP